MTYRIEQLFPTPLYSAHVNNFEVIKNKIDGCIEKIDFQYREQWGRTHLLTDPTFTEDILTKYGLNVVKKEIDYHLKQYCKELRFPLRKYDMSSWFIMMREGNYAHIHDHCPTDISGVLYYKTNSDDGDIHFHTPHPFFKMSKCFNNQSWRHRPEEGKILLFPGWLQHGVETNTTDNVRISLSFNIQFKEGVMGN